MRLLKVITVFLALKITEIFLTIFPFAFTIALMFGNLAIIDSDSAIGFNVLNGLATFVCLVVFWDDERQRKDHTISWMLSTNRCIILTLSIEMVYLYFVGLLTKIILPASEVVVPFAIFTMIGTLIGVLLWALVYFSIPFIKSNWEKANELVDNHEKKN